MISIRREVLAGAGDRNHQSDAVLLARALGGHASTASVVDAASPATKQTSRTVAESMVALRRPAMLLALARATRSTAVHGHVAAHVVLLC